MTLELYTDGGTVGRNPSTQGGTWAWCQVFNGRKIKSACGLATPDELEVELATNNVMELYAAVRGIESLPEDFTGRVYTDSLITIYRLTDSYKFNGVPEWLKERVLEIRDRRRDKSLKWQYDCVLLGGHPTKNELEAGVRKDGKMVSKWNCWCDRKCRELAEKWSGKT